MRCAIYFIPPPDDALTQAATRWLGRDAYSGNRVDTGVVEGLIDEDRAFLTAPVRRYGLHATLKAPFLLAEGTSIEALASALRSFSKQHYPMLIPKTEIRLFENFFALVPTCKNLEIEAMAADLVTSFDRFRVPMSETELSRRYPYRLTERQHANLLQFGYPYILQDYRFHMTLTGPVPSLERSHVSTVLNRYFGALATAPIVLDQIALFFESEPHAPFIVHSIHKFARETSRETSRETTRLIA